VEWTGWSRIGTSHVMQAGSPTLAPSGAPIDVAFQYQNGWFYSIGLEYVFNPAWTVRAGIAYEKSPISDRVRIPLLPDNDRTWFSVGATHHITRDISLDLAYSYIDFKNTPINVTPGNPSFNGAVTYVGTASSHFNVLSIGLKYRFNRSLPAVTKG
jgi:long-chain fatty acid transport protein